MARHSLLALFISVGTTFAALASTPTLSPEAARTADIIVHGVVDGDPDVDLSEHSPDSPTYIFKLKDVVTLNGTLAPGATLLHQMRGPSHIVVRANDHVLLAIRKLDRTVGGPSSLFQVLERVKFSPEAVKLAQDGIAALPAVPDALSIAMRQIAPGKKVNNWQAPFGDGLFEVKVRNTGKVAITLPEVVFTNGLERRVIRPAGSLAAGKSETLKVNALSLKWKSLPAGGRLDLSVQCGRRSVSSFFFFKKDVHGSMIKKKKRR